MMPPRDVGHWASFGSRGKRKVKGAATNVPRDQRQSTAASGSAETTWALDETILAADAVTRKRIAEQHGPVDQTGGFDRVGTHQFDLPGILLRTAAGNAKETPPRQPRVTGAKWRTRT
jgi:hypothetical protein